TDADQAPQDGAPVLRSRSAQRNLSRRSPFRRESADYRAGGAPLQWRNRVLIAGAWAPGAGYSACRPPPLTLRVSGQIVFCGSGGTATVCGGVGAGVAA